MRPIHLGIFSILEKIPMDGTFNQVAPINILIKRFYPSRVRGTLFGSVDLSAATDRLPLSLQTTLMKGLGARWGIEDPAMFSKAWADMLVLRKYRVKLPPGFDSDVILPKEVPQ